MTSSQSFPQSISLSSLFFGSLIALFSLWSAASFILDAHERLQIKQAAHQPLSFHASVRWQESVRLILAQSQWSQQALDAGFILRQIDVRNDTNGFGESQFILTLQADPIVDLQSSNPLSNTIPPMRFERAMTLRHHTVSIPWPEFGWKTQTLTPSFSTPYESYERRESLSSHTTPSFEIFARQLGDGLFSSLEPLMNHPPSLGLNLSRLQNQVSVSFPVDSHSSSIQLISMDVSHPFREVHWQRLNPHLWTLSF